MSLEDPITLRLALSVTPLTHLIPKQDMFPMIATLDLTPVVPLAEEGRVLNTNGDEKTDQTEKNSAGTENRAQKALTDDELLLIEELDKFESPLVLEIFEKTATKTAHDTTNDEKLSPFEAAILKGNTFSYSPKHRQERAARPHIYTPSELEEMPKDEFMEHYNRVVSQNKSSALKRNLDLDIVEGSKRLHKSLIEDDRLQLEQFVHQIASTEGSANSNWQPSGEINLLTIASLTTLNDHITRAFSALSTCDTDCLLQIQRWCNTSVIFGCSIDWDTLKKNIEAESSQRIKNHIETALGSIIASKIILLILNGSRKDIKQLHVEEPLVAVVDFVLQFVDALRLLISSKTTKYKSSLGRCISSLSSVITTLIRYISTNDLDDNLVTKLEYLCVSLIFYDTPPKNAETAVPMELVESIKMDLSSLILTIFKRYADQRLFILNEIFNSIDKLTLSKVKTVKVGRGVGVQLHTALLVNLLQSVDSYQLEQLIKTYGPRKKHNTRSLKEVVSSATAITSETREIAVKAVEGLLSSIPGGNMTSKQVLQSLVDDLIGIVANPECPAAMVYIECLFSTFVKILQEGFQKATQATSQQESFALDMIGVIGEKLLDLGQDKNSFGGTSLAPVSTEEISEMRSSMESTLCRMQGLKNKNPELQDAFNFLILQFISFMEPFVDNPVNESQLQALNSEPDSPETNSTEVVEYLLNALAEGSVTLRSGATQIFDNAAHIKFRSHGTLSQLHKSFVAIVVEALGSNKIKLKSRAIKILSVLVEKNDAVLLQPKVQEVISETLFDSSALVRDASIDLVTKYLTSKPEVIRGFYKVICEMFNDDSVQVRRRVVKFARVMYENTKERRIKVYIAVRMLDRTHDEDDFIVEQLNADYIDLWIKKHDTIPILEVAEVMMDVAMKREEAFRYWLENKILDTDFQTGLYPIIDSLIGFVIDGMNTRYQKDVDKALYLISIFVLYNGKMINQSQLLSFLPFLQDDTTPQASYLRILMIYRHVIPAFVAMSPTFASSVESLLLSKLTKYGFKALQEAVPCLWSLCSRTESSQKVVNALISCIRMLKPLMKQLKDPSDSAKDVIASGKAAKLIDLLGSFGAYCNFEKHRETLTMAAVGLRENETVTSLVSKYLLFFCEGHGDELALVSIRALILVSSRNPQLFTSNLILDILDKSFEKKSSIQAVVVEGLYDFLKLEHNVKNVKERQTKGKKKGLKFGATSALEGVSGSIAQRYTPLILKLCLNGDETAQSAFTLLREIVESGLANPKVCIPTVIALEASPNAWISDEAKKLHLHMIEHHESLVSSNYPESIRLAQQVNKHSKLFLQLLYEIASQTASSKKKLVAALVKCLKVQLRIGTEESLAQLKLVKFVVSNAAEVKFLTLEEVLSLIVAIERELSREGMDLAEQLEDGTQDLPKKQVYGLFYATEGLSGMLHFRNFLCEKFGISRSQIEAFNPRRLDSEFRREPEVTNVGPLLYEWHMDKTSRAEMTKVFTRFIEEMDTFS